MSTPDSTETYTLVYDYIQRIEDAGEPTSNNADVPARYLPCLTYALAYNIACKNPEALNRVPMIKQRYDELWTMLVMLIEKKHRFDSFLTYHITITKSHARVTMTIEQKFLRGTILAIVQMKIVSMLIIKGIFILKKKLEKSGYTQINGILTISAM